MYSTDFEARKAIINKLGGDTVNLTNIFQCELVILALYGGDPSDVNNIFEADKKILTLLGGDVSGVTSVFDARKAIITQLGGDASLVNSLISASEIELEYASIKEENPPYVTFTAEEAGSTLGLAKKYNYFTLEYSSDTENWSRMTTSTSIALANIGDKVYVRGKLTKDLSYINYTLFAMSGKIAASGSCNALWNYEDPEAQLRKYCGCYMFLGCTSLTQAPELPATTLARYCYYNMFDGCTSLTQAPELPATTLDNNCYYNMFKGCTSLTQAPELPAMSLSTSCYGYMFYGCTSLTQAPELPATELAQSCYYSMFDGCTRLSTIKCLATYISATEALSNWTNNVASTGTFYKALGVWWPTGTSGIPSAWTVVEL